MTSSGLPADRLGLLLAGCSPCRVRSAARRAGGLTADGDERRRPTARGRRHAAAPRRTCPCPTASMLTAQGSELAVGDTATVAYEPRQDEVGVLDAHGDARSSRPTFEERSTAGSSDARPKPAPYFVRRPVTVKNVGETDLGGRRGAALRRRRRQHAWSSRSPFAGDLQAVPERRAARRSSDRATRSKACLVFLVADQGDLDGGQLPARPRSSTRSSGPARW